MKTKNSVAHKFNRHVTIILCLMSAIAAFSLSSCKTSLDSLKNKYAAGTNINEVTIKQKANDSFFEYENYCFWNEGKYSVSVHCDTTREIDCNLFTKKKIGSKKDLENINSGDDIFDVVSNTGIPISRGDDDSLRKV